jgi:RHH-type rel operon transcriptional repressor/antitoxin RelB
MLGVRLSKELEDRLEALSQKTQRSKSYYVRKAITDFLEDQEDYLLAVSILEKGGKRHTLEDVERMMEEQNSSSHD